MKAKLKLIWSLYVMFLKRLNNRTHILLKLWMLVLAPMLPMIGAPPANLTEFGYRIGLYYTAVFTALFVTMTLLVWWELRHKKKGAAHG